MALDIDSNDNQERSGMIEEGAMLVVGLLVAPIAVGFWGALLFLKLLNYPARAVHLWMQHRGSLPRDRTGVAHSGDGSLGLF